MEEDIDMEKVKGYEEEGWEKGYGDLVMKKDI